MTETMELNEAEERRARAAMERFLVVILVALSFGFGVILFDFAELWATVTIPLVALYVAWHRTMPVAPRDGR